MTERRVFILAHPEARRRALAYVAEAPDGHVVKVSEPNRTLAQNAAQWPYLVAFSKQLLWPVNGSMVRLEPDEWKAVLTAAFEGETVRLAAGLNGGVVMLGMKTSKLGVKRFSEWFDFLQAVAADRGVVVYPERETEPA